MRQFVAIALSSALVLQVGLLAAPAKAGSKAGAQAAASGSINGIARSSSGEVLPSYTVQLRNLQTGQLAGTTRSDVVGSFSFTDLPAGNYVVELVSPTGRIVGSSALIAVGSGATVTVSLTAAAFGGAAAAGSTGGISTALIVTSLAAAAGIAAVIVVSRGDASPSR